MNRIRLMLVIQLVGQAILVVEKVVLFPLYIHTWGLHVFGEWMILRIIPNYLTLSELGVSVSIGNLLAKYHNRNDIGSISTVVYSGAFLISLLSVFIYAISYIVVGFIDWNSAFNIDLLSDDADKIFYLFTLHAILILYSQFLYGCLRGSETYIVGSILIQVIRGIEVFLASIGLLMNLLPQEVAFLYLTGRLIGVCLLLFFVIKKVRLTLVAYISIINTARNLIKPSVSFMAFPFSQMLTNQGTIMIIAVISGPTQVAVFQILKTLSGLMNQGGSLLYRTYIAEYAIILTTEGKRIPVTKLISKQSLITVMGATIAALILICFGETIYSYWVPNESVFRFQLFFQLVIAGFFYIIWQSFLAIPSAINQHIKLAKIYIALSCTTLFTCYLILRFGDIDYIGTVFIVNEALMLYFVLVKVKRILN